VLRSAGLSVAVNVKHPDVAAAADVVVDDTDLCRLLELFPGSARTG